MFKKYWIFLKVLENFKCKIIGSKNNFEVAQLPEKRPHERNYWMR
jgi:hypothetical protein